MLSSRPILSRLLFWTALVAVWGVGVWAYLDLIIWPGVETIDFEALDRTFEILAPQFFGVLLVLPLLAIPARFTLSDFPGYQRIVNLSLRALVIAVIVGALIQVVMTSFDSRVATIFLVDTSASFPDEALDEALLQVNAAVESLDENDQVTVIAFAKRPYIVEPDADGTYSEIPRPQPPQGLMGSDSTYEEGDGPTGLPAGIDDDDRYGTDISAALRMAYGLFPDDHLKRVVLITDGNETHGDFLAEVNRAADFGIRIFAHNIEFEPPPEVMIQGVDAPENIEMGAPFYLTARIFSTHDDRVNLTLWQNEYRDDEKSVDVPPGVTEVRFETQVYEPGFREFRINMEVEGRDTHEANNQYVHTAHIRGEPRILYIEGEMRSRHYLEGALRNENFDVETRGPGGVPETEEEIDRFDLILLSDVHADQFSERQMSLFDTYVRDMGGGLIMAGGEDSFGPGGWEGTVVEDLMPIHFDGEQRRETPGLAILLVIDRSGSMAEHNRMELAREAARAAVNALEGDAEIGILAFDHEVVTISRIQPVSNRSRILSQINRIQLRGGTDIALALAESYEKMAFNPARIRHVILLTDGISPEDNIFTEIMPAMRLENISVTTVAVGSDAETSLMRRVAAAGNGRFYFTTDPYNIPQIFTQETRNMAHSALIEEPFRPQVTSRAQVLQGIQWDQAPFLLGYVSTRPKSQADVLLTSDQGEPLLARWRVGLGKTAVFTSDIKNRWGVQWVRWAGYSQLWAQLIRDTMRTDDRDHLPMRAFIDQDRGRVVIDAIGPDDRFINDLDSDLHITDPEGGERHLQFYQTAPGRYEATFDLGPFGSYHLAAQHQRHGDSFAVSQTSLSYPYPRELSFIEANTSLVEQAVTLAGGEINPSVEAIFDPQGEEVRYRRHLWPYFVALALMLLVLDLALRRIRLSGSTNISWSELVSR